MNNTFLSNLNWRYATKKFDPKKKVDDKTLDKILEAIRMTPTSLGLQTMHIFVVTDQKLKEKIKPKSFNQDQVADCSHLLVFCYRNDPGKRVGEYVEMVSKGKLMNKLKLKPMEAMMRGYVVTQLRGRVSEWSARQVYIALGFAMAACAELQVDSCPMEGFNPKSIDKILELPKNMKSVLFLPIGYRKVDPEKKKIRFSRGDMFAFV